MSRWYVVHTHAHAEDKALHHLRRQGFDAYLPKYLKRRRHARKTDWVPSPLFPRYLFVRMDIDAERWRAVHSTVGVAHLICHGDAPAPVPAGIVEDIRRHEEADGTLRLFDVDRMRRGDAVEVLDGAFASRTGIFDCVDDQDRVVILLGLLGRHVRVRLPKEAVAACA